MSLAILPPVDGSLVLSEVLQFNLEHNSHIPFYIFSSKNSERTTEISHLEFVRASHRAAHAIRPNRVGEDGQVVAIIASLDTILYQALVMGTILAGLIPFPISPRNSPAAIISMLCKTSCHRLVTTQTTLHQLIHAIESELHVDMNYRLSISEVPQISTLYPKLGVESEQDPFTPYPASTKRPELSDIMIYIHSSGSTGFPKPIPQTHQTILHWAAFPCITGLSSHNPPIRLTAMSSPPYHAMAIILQLVAPLFTGEGICVYPPMSVSNPHVLPIFPNSDNIIEHARRTGANALLAVPTFLETWEQSSDAIEFLKTLEFVAFGGGPLVPKKGDSLVASGVKVRPFYGGTEFGAPTSMVPTKWDIENGNWDWMRFSPRTNIRWSLQGDGSAELQFLTSQTHQLAVENLPDVKGYATSDLWEKHPTEDGLFRIVGRLDDVLILASGEKTVPVPMENIIMTSPLVRGTIMFGRQRNQVGILIEPAQGHEFDPSDEEALAGFRNKIWPEIEQANEGAPAFSRIFKEMILVTRPDKPMLRAPKGTVIRKKTLKEYESEIEKIYEVVEASAEATPSVDPPQSWSQADVEAWFLLHIVDISSGRDIKADEDLFEQGFDSLSATFLRNRIIGALRSSSDDSVRNAASEVTQNIVFAHPSIKELTSCVVDLVNHRDGDVDSTIIRGRKRIEKMVEKYSAGLGGSVLDGTPSGGPTVVLLTGSTGGLGSYVLAELLERDDVEQIIAFNRPSTTSSISERQRAAFGDRGLDLTLLKSPKLVYVEGNAAKDKLGLSDELYDKLRGSTTHIIHNAWRLDFNLALSSFESNIRGTRNLVDFALTSAYASSFRFIFTSSIATAQSWGPEKGPYPEEVQMDAGFAVGAGYGEGKYVAERIIAKSGLQASSIRIGQISGGINGAWAVSDWVPILVRSSVELGCLPDAQGIVTWTPVHAVSRTILDVAFFEKCPPVALNLTHTRPVEWHAVMETIGKTLHEKYISHEELPLVPLTDWFAKIQERAESATESELTKIPAIKLLDFFEAFTRADVDIRAAGRGDVESGGLTPLSTEKMRTVSQTMRGINPLGPEDAVKWVEYWVSKGLFAKM